MIRKEIYPKTKRLPIESRKLVNITEKLDGSNLCFFKLEEKTYFAQRNNIFCFDEIEEAKGALYKGLYQWLLDNKEVFEAELHEGSAICGEWLGMGKIKYDIGDFDKRWYMFAKANINENFELYNLIYDRKFFIFPFKSQEIPKFIGVVPLVAELTYLPEKANLDVLYDKYTKKEDRQVEGFVVEYNDAILKYVRLKNGKLQEHFDRGE